MFCTADVLVYSRVKLNLQRAISSHCKSTGEELWFMFSKAGACVAVTIEHHMNTLSTQNAHSNLADVSLVCRGSTWSSYCPTLKSLSLLRARLLTCGTDEMRCQCYVTHTTTSHSRSFWCKRGGDRQRALQRGHSAGNMIRKINKKKKLSGILEAVRGKRS